jgi:hypothetical protein
MPRFRVLFLMGLTPLMWTAAAWAQSRPTGTPPATAAAPASRPAAVETPRTWFGRSGKTVTVEFAQARAPMDHAALLAFGRSWTDAVATRKQGVGFVADFKVPAVRVPTVFTVANPDQPNQWVGELVAYPDRDVEWDKKITLYSCGAPEWFRQWASATGLPVNQVAVADLPAATLSAAEEKGVSLLILGRPAAGKNVADVAKLAGDKKINVVVLEAAWFGKAAGPAAIAPAEMSGGLAEVERQHWPQPLKFSSHRRPWPGIANRRAWIADETGLPLVEELLLPPSRAVWAWAADAPVDQTWKPEAQIGVSYVPWDQQLGRREQADELLQQILISATKNVKPRPWAGVLVYYPERESKKLDAVLAAAPLAPGAIGVANQPRVWMIDLRGENLPQTESFDKSARFLAGLAGRPGGRERLLILGDDKMLDEWEWLKLDRAKKTINRPGVVWMQGDELPPSRDNQIRLMLKLTELGVPLAAPEKGETEHD